MTTGYYFAMYFCNKCVGKYCICGSPVQEQPYGCLYPRKDLKPNWSPVHSAPKVSP